jgi:hypothetical protein
MRSAKLALAAAVVTIFLAAPVRHAHAQTGATLVAIVTAEPNSSLTRRVRAELHALGVDVIVLNPPDEGSPSRAPLERAARAVGAVAAVRLIASSEGKVEVWVADRVTGKAVVRELDAPGNEASDAAVAVGSVELLRASLMELHSGEPPHGDAPANEAIRSLALPAEAPAPLPRLGLQAGAGAELGLGGLGPSLDAEIAIWIRIASRFGARVLGHTSLTPSRVTTASGAVDVRSLLLGAMGTYALVDPSGAWVPSVSVGIAAAHVSAAGTAVPPFVSASEDTWALAPVGSLGLAWAFAPGLRLSGDALAAWTVPAVHVTTPAGAAGSWGAPALIVSLGLEVLWER